MSQRRPALIPPDLRLSSEDERSILLRIGNLHLDSLRMQPPSSNHNSAGDLSSSIPAPNASTAVLTATHAKLAIPKPGTKRKASTTSEQHHEQSYGGEDKLSLESNLQNPYETGSRSRSWTVLPGPMLRSTNIPVTDGSCLEFEYESLSPKDLTGLVSRDVFF